MTARRIRIVLFCLCTLPHIGRIKLPNSKDLTNGAADVMPHDIGKGLAAGFFRYLTKPIKINEFMAALDLAH